MATFSFSSEAPSQQLFADVQNLNSFSDEQLVRFVSITLAFISQDPSATQQLNQFATDNGVNPKALNSTVRGVLFFFTEALKSNLAPGAVKDDLIKLGLQEPKAELLCVEWKQKFAALSSNMIGKTLNVDKLVDMEWKFGVAAATDELKDVGSCFLQLKLVLDKGTHREDVLMELSLPQFYQFLQQMQKACAQCSY
eukprot:CAMPEP_0175092474 /NCGR_PEP_ID=MMETSP0086_2-20121207/2482_1 /TAXON_ID=136419 /ORGANISM="Unknown Unknown, Strain D1" /LENGTH=195 /DNA_ID=CAMNT_0016365339 /DNA_START=50 /DNA_END=637 /DNA_ORIENTATION=-